jgi:dyslexia susceptibility 1 candidate gene 1 protein
LIFLVTLHINPLNYLFIHSFIYCPSSSSSSSSSSSFLCQLLVFLVTASTLKVNFSPYLIDIVLFGTVDSLRHKAKVRTGVLKITLFKSLENQKIWGSLEVSDDEDKKSLRQSSSLKQQEVEEKLLASRKDRKVSDERHSVRKQMALEEAERNRLEGKKEEEKHNAEEEMYATFSKLQSSSLTADDKASPLREPTSTGAHDYGGVLAKKSSASAADGTIDDDIDDVESVGEQEAEKANTSNGSDMQNEYGDFDGATDMTALETEDGDLKYIPPPRSVNSDSNDGSKVNIINFTPRVFPTPMRESTQANEEDWVAKNRKHLKKHGTLGQNIPKGRCSERICIAIPP